MSEQLTFQNVRDCFHSMSMIENQSYTFPKDITDKQCSEILVLLGKMQKESKKEAHQILEAATISYFNPTVVFPE